MPMLVTATDFHEACLQAAAARFSPGRAAISIRAMLRRHGVEVAEDKSTISRSRYLTAMTKDGRSLCIRVSDHAARPTYQVRHGEADIEVGVHHDADALDVRDAFRVILRRLGITPDARTSAKIAEYDAEVAEIRREVDAHREAMRAEEQRRAEEWREVEALARQLALDTGTPLEQRSARARRNIRIRAREILSRSAAMAE